MATLDMMTTDAWKKESGLFANRLRGYDGSENLSASSAIFVGGTINEVKAVMKSLSSLSFADPIGKILLAQNIGVTARVRAQEDISFREEENKSPPRAIAELTFNFSTPELKKVCMPVLRRRIAEVGVSL